MQFNTIEEIRSYYGIESERLDDIKKFITDSIKSIHPNANRGEFKSGKDKKDYHILESALEFLKSNNTTNEIITTNQINEIVKAVIKEMTPITSSNSDEVALHKVLESNQLDCINTFKVKHRGIRLSSAGLMVVLTSIWLFPKIIDSHKVLSHLLSDPLILSIIWLIALLGTSMVWIVTKNREQLLNDITSSFSIEKVQNNMFTLFIEFSSQDYSFWHESSSNIKFTKDDLTNFLINDYHDLKFQFDRKKSASSYVIISDFRKREIHDEPVFKKLYLRIFRYRPRKIELELANSLSEIIIIRLLERNVIQKLENIGLSETFTFKRNDH